ncbi:MULTISPECIES: hypothetical protein [Acinetobacter calcoaceticus/baumannii complex]|nr:hypothetical protein [Acinetobacter baumannii]
MKIFLHDKPDSSVDDYCIVKKINTTWNDFGFQSKVRLEISFSNKILTLQAYYTAYFDNEFVTLNSVNSQSLKDSNFYQYILLESTKEYKKLKDYFPDDFDNILKNINDISFLRMKKNRNKNFNLLLQSEIFNKSFIRSNESFGAYLYGYTSSDYNQNFNTKKVSAYNPLINKDFIFEINENTTLNFLPFRHFIMIGRNGSGKSQSLRKLALKYRDRKEFNCVACFSQFDKTNSFSKKIKGIHHINLTKSKKNIEILHSIIRMKFDVNFYESYSFDILVDLINYVDFMKNIVIYKDKNSYLSLNELVEFNSGEQNTLEKIKEIASYNKFKIKKDCFFYDLSSGENFFINLVFNLIDIVNQYKNNILFLFDEPESFLHPNFISILSEIICYFTNRLYCTAVTATHCIYLVKNSLQENIIIFRKNNEKMELEKPSFNTFGANLNSLSYFIFGFESPLEHENSVIEKIIEIENKRKSSFVELIDTYGQFLSSETIDRIYMKLQNEKD